MISILNNTSDSYNKKYSKIRNNYNNSPTDNNKYEDYNVVSKTGNSIFSPEFENRIDGQIYVSEAKIIEIVQRELDKRLGVLSNNNGNDNN